MMVRCPEGVDSPAKIAMSVLRDAWTTMDLLRDDAVRRRIFRAMPVDMTGNHRSEANIPAFAAQAGNIKPARPEIGNSPLSRLFL
jgi:hypothetical protein